MLRPMITPEQKAAMKKREEKMDMPGTSIGESYWPQTIEFTAQQLPEVKKWEVGEEYMITVKAKMVRYEQKKSNREGNKKEKEIGCFEIVAVQTEGEGMNTEQKKISDFMKD